MNTRDMEECQVEDMMLGDTMVLEYLSWHGHHQWSLERTHLKQKA